MLACLRAPRPAGALRSGYLLTDPPPGRPRLLGADASHAWVARLRAEPRLGRVRSDQRHARRPRYITLAWGADFADVVPLRGVILGGRGQTHGGRGERHPRGGGDRAPPLKGAPRGGGEPDLGGMARAAPARTLTAVANQEPPSCFTQPALPPSLQPIEVHPDEPTRPRPAGPGWFDSSWELRAGLRVEEGLPADLGVCAWIETWLQLAAAGASPSLSAT